MNECAQCLELDYVLYTILAHSKIKLTRVWSPRASTLPALLVVAVRLKRSETLSTRDFNFLSTVPMEMENGFDSNSGFQWVEREAEKRWLNEILIKFRYDLK